MYLKFQHKCIELYFIQNGEFVETIPMDLTSFILWHLENNRDLSDFFNQFINLESTDTLSEKISRFIKYLHIYETAESLLTTSHVLNQFIQNQENITRNEISEQIINCFANLEFEQLLIVTKRNNQIWNYLPNEIQKNEQILQYQPISFENERERLIKRFNLLLKPNVPEDHIFTIIHTFINNKLKISEFSWATLQNEPKKNYLIDNSNNIVIEIDHFAKDIWILKSRWESMSKLTKETFKLTEQNFVSLLQIYFMSDSIQLNTFNKRLHSHDAFFNPLWLNAANYTPKPTGEYARIHWDIIKQELNIL